MLERISYSDVGRFSWNIWGPRKKDIPLLMVGMGTAAFLDTLFPVLAGRLMDAVTSANTSTHSLIITFCVFIGIDVAYHTVRNNTVFMWNRRVIENLRDVTAQAFAKVQKFSSNWHANNFAGGTVRKITRGMWSFDVFQDNIFFYLYPTLIVMISTVTMLSLRWPLMGLLTFISMVIYIGFSVWAVVVINAPKSKKSADMDTHVGSAIADAITGNSAVKSFGTEYHEERRLGGVLIRWRDAALDSWQTYVLNDLIRRYLSVVMMAVMVGMALYLWRGGQANAGDVIYVFTAYLVLSAYLRNIGEQISNMQKAISEMEDVVWFWKTDIAVQDKPNAVSFKPVRGEIIFDRVTFGYKGQTKPIYQDFSLNIRAGEKIALVGPSGSGKSTFVKLLQRLYDIDSGAIIIDGQNIADVTQSSLRQHLALVPQEPMLFHRALSENIAYGKNGASTDDIIAAAQKAYAHDFIMSLPQGYDTLVGERGIKLSGGERQRVAIARAILTDAKVLILDEATSSLDSISEHYIQKALETLMQGRTVITIAHRLATIKSVDRILVFDHGSIVEQGTHAELIGRTDSHYKRLYAMQALDLVGEDYQNLG
jgi:ATP-binding cassette, subfamily B, bacterial